MLTPSADPDELTVEEVNDMRETAGADVAEEISAMVGDDPDADLAFETIAETRAALDGHDLPEEGEFVRDETADVAFPGQPEEGPKPGKAEAVAIVRGILAQIGVGNEFEPKDLYEAVEASTGRTATWLRQTLPVLVAEGCIEPTAGRGRYIVLESDPRPELSYVR